jgi:AbrB family looped-hinge helix DNA binding protein
MAKAKITAKGQVTIPQEVRERMGLRMGDEIEFIEERGDYHLRKRVRRAALQRYRGYLKDLAGGDPDEIVERMRGS